MRKKVVLLGFTFLLMGAIKVSALCIEDANSGGGAFRCYGGVCSIYNTSDKCIYSV